VASRDEKRLLCGKTRYYYPRSQSVSIMITAIEFTDFQVIRTNCMCPACACSRRAYPAETYQIGTRAAKQRGRIVGSSSWLSPGPVVNSTLLTTLVIVPTQSHSHGTQRLQTTRQRGDNLNCIAVDGRQFHINVALHTSYVGWQELSTGRPHLLCC
jgi:hypothetical protein